MGLWRLIAGNGPKKALPKESAGPLRSMFTQDGRNVWMTVPGKSQPFYIGTVDDVTESMTNFVSRVESTTKR